MNTPPWLADNHPKRATRAEIDPWPSVPGPQLEQLGHAWIARGGSVDQHGNRLHPHWRPLLADPRIGLPTGPGFFWRLGPNDTADVVALRDGPDGEEVLLIQRADNGRFALPGGFLGPDDATAEAGALRELFEETGLRPEAPHTRVLRRLLPNGSLTTLHAWTEHTVVLLDADPDWLARAEPTRREADGEVQDAMWLAVSRLDDLDMANRHPGYVELALHHRRTRSRA